jgi:hypothetical protein
MPENVTADEVAFGLTFKFNCSYTFAPKRGFSSGHVD